jgi:2-methylcitrate dehydratase
LVDGELTPRQFTPARFTDARLLDLVARIQVHGDATINERYPGTIPNRLAVTMTDGKRLVAEVGFPFGHPNNPMTDANVEQKFRSLVEPRFGKERSDKILAACWELETLETTSELLDLLG